MKDRAKKVKNQMPEEFEFRSGLLDRIEDAIAHGDRQSIAQECGITRNTVTNLRTNKKSPSVWTVFKIGKVTKRRPAWLAFGELPEDNASQHLVALIAAGLNRASDDTRRAALRVLGIEPDSIPSGTVIKVHDDGVKTYDAPPEQPLPLALAREAPAPYGRKITPAQMQRICQIVGDYIEHKTPLVSLKEADDLRHVLAQLQSLVDVLPNPPTGPGRVDAPSAGDATETGEPLNQRQKTGPNSDD